MAEILTFTDPAGGTSLAVTVPTSWADVTLETFLKLHSVDETQMLAAFTGLDVATVAQLAADDVVYFANALAFVSDALMIQELPATAGLPEVGSAPYGLLVLATQHVESLPEGAPGIQAGPYLYALYRCQQIYGKVDDAKIEAIRLATLAAPVTEVYADVAFFLNSYKRAINGTRPAKRTPSSPTATKRKRDWKALVKGLVRSSHSTRPPQPSA